MAERGLQQTVLIIEDDPGIALLEAEALEDLGYDAIHCTSGLEVCETLRGARPALMLLDYSLPDMTGIQLLERLRKDRIVIPPFIVTTGAGDERVAVELMRRGAINYLTKDHDFLQALPVAIGRAMEEINLKARLKRLERRARLAAKIIEMTNEAIFVTNADHRIIEANPACVDITGYELEELIGLFPSELLTGSKNDAAINDDIRTSLDGRGVWQGELQLRRKGGELFTGWFNISRISAEGEPPVYVTLFSDISTVTSRAEHLDYLAHHDPLTGLPNRLLFNARLRHSLDKAERAGAGVGLIYLDLDHFKVVNDTLGHAVGDDLLRLIADNITALLRQEDTFSRLGGDEFAILLEKVGHGHDCQRLVERVLTLFPHPVQVGDQIINVSASIGFARYPTDAIDPISLLARADEAMYAAKQAGRNTVVAYADVDDVT